MTQSSLSAVASREPKLPIIDDEHLGRMTLGDRTLEREVLEIFARQISLTLQRVHGAAPARAAAAAHTLKGSARGVGAWFVAEAAEHLEQAAADSDREAMIGAVAELEGAGFAARSEIEARLGMPLDDDADICGDRSRDH